MRRRILLENKNIEYVFSAETTTTSITTAASSVQIAIASKANNQNCQYIVYSYDGTVVTSVTTAATSVTIKCSKNTTTSSRNGTVKLIQNGSNNTIEITINQNAVVVNITHSAIILEYNSGSTGSTTIDILDTPTIKNVPSHLTVAYNNGTITATAKTENTNVSGNSRVNDITLTFGTQTKTLTIIQMPKAYLKANNYDYVTMPSYKIATCNVGATKPYNYGYLYQWGAGSTKYKSGTTQYYTGSSTTLPSTYDTTTVTMGGNWGTFTQGDASFLKDNKTVVNYWATYNGINGKAFRYSYQVLFFPAAGIYDSNGKRQNVGIIAYSWINSRYTSAEARMFRCTNTTINQSFFSKEFGLPVRGRYT